MVFLHSCELLFMQEKHEGDVSYVISGRVPKFFLLLAGFILFWGRNIYIDLFTGSFPLLHILFLGKSAHELHRVTDTVTSIASSNTSKTHQNDKFPIHDDTNVTIRLGTSLIHDDNMQTGDSSNFERNITLVSESALILDDDMLEDDSDFEIELGEDYPQLLSNVSDIIASEDDIANFDYARWVNFSIPDYNMNCSGEYYIKSMSSFKAQRYSQISTLANSHRLSQFFQAYRIPIPTTETIWSKSIVPWISNHEYSWESDSSCRNFSSRENNPLNYVMKTTHCSGCVLIIHEGKITKQNYIMRNWEAALRRTSLIPTVSQSIDYFCKLYLNASYIYHEGRGEWWYKYMTRDIVVEKMLVDSEGNIPSDYKIFVFAGEPVYLYVTTCRECNPPVNQIYYVAENRWELMPYFYKKRASSDEVYPPPRCWEHMRKLAKLISRGIPFVRTDFYDLNFSEKSCEENVIVGEMTFRPHGGEIVLNFGEEFNYIMGKDANYYYLEQYPCKHGIDFDVDNFDVVLFDLDDCIWRGDVQFIDGDNYTLNHGLESFGGDFRVELFPTVRPFMKCLRIQKPSIKFAVASHGPQPQKSRQAMEAFGILDMIDPELIIFQTLHTSEFKTKKFHFLEVQRKSGYDFSKFAFFDNKRQYCDEAASLGMFAIHIFEGFPELTRHGDLARRK